MREIPLTRGAVALVDDEDYARLAAHRWYCTSTGYAARGVREGGRQRQVKMHREILGFHDSEHTDHADGNKLNNTRANIRPCTCSQNFQNRAPLRGRPYKGVSRQTQCKNRWQARISIDGRQRSLGLFRSPEEAARAYDAAAIEHFGEFARLNFPDERQRLAS